VSFVEIRDLTFAYDRRQPPVIERFSLSVEKGRSLASSDRAAAAKAPFSA